MKVIEGENEEAIQIDELHHLQLMTNRKNESYGTIWDCNGSLAGHVGYNGESREEAIKQAKQKVADKY
ncbi:hypothetical protein QUA13_24330 [Microcoleus sp. S28C3]